MKKFHFGLTIDELTRIVAMVTLLMDKYNSVNTNVPIIPGNG